MDEDPWCPIHQRYKPCEHNGGVLTLERGWVTPEEAERDNLTDCTVEEWHGKYEPYE
jgi:hypothetical protein